MRSEERKQTGLVLSAVIPIDAIAYFGRLIEPMDSVPCIRGSNQITYFSGGQSEFRLARLIIYLG